MIPSPNGAPPMLDLRDLARTLGVAQVDLARWLSDDGVPLLQLSAKRWRVAGADYDAWSERRKAKVVQDAAQRRLRMGHVAGKASGSSASGERVRFKR